MFRFIPRPVHAATDYMFAALLAASPSMVGFEEDKEAVLAARALAGTTVVASLMTRYELGLVRVLPFNLHLLLDLLAAVPTIAAPCILGFDDNKPERDTFVAFGIFEIIAVLLSKRDGD